MPIPTEPLRLVQVGAGSMGRNWLDAIADSPDTELVALVDLDPETATRAAADGGLSVVVGRSLSEVLDQVQADAVVNVTVPQAHREVCTTALLRGLAVLSEKPLADTVSAGLSMMAAAEVSGRLLMVSQSRRYWRTLSALRTQLTRLGRIGLIECSFFKAPHFGGFRDQMAYPLLLDMAIHQFDLARDLVGSDPVSVSCESFNPPWSWYAGDAAAKVDFTFADSVHFGFTGSWCAPGLETSWNGSWRISAEGGTAIWDGDHEPVAETADGTHLPAVVGAEPEQIAGSLAEFVAALRTGERPSGEVHRNIVSLAMVEAAISSAEGGRRVAITDLLDDAYGAALRAEDHPEVLTQMTRWSSVHDAMAT
ncbi:MAG: Gfo/Idh/MocA family protein [Propionibacteriaceae bacterium]